MKLTPWFSGDVKPVREGVYERQYNEDGSQYCYWNGKFWGLYATIPKIAVWLQNSSSADQNLPWRGVEK